jgi:hypothetical protein
VVTVLPEVDDLLGAGGAELLFGVSPLTDAAG